MAAVFNQYSLFLVVLVILAVVGVILFRKPPRLPELIAFFVILLGLVVAWFTLRPTQTPLSNAAEEVRARIGSGKPVLLEFQSPY
jgi:peptidoglycan/LPS O-acetylase OafA/YrhL